MPVIKRYPNRKLYDTEAKQYITLDGIAEMIRAGREVQVVDNASGEDLTAVTLSQIIFEQEKKQSGFLPRAVLTSLIQSGGDRFSALQRALRDTMGFWNQIDEEIHRRIHLLVKQGELSENEGRRLIDKLLRPGLHAAEEESLAPRRFAISEGELEQYLNERQVPTREDLQTLLAQLNTLASKLEELEQEQAEGE